MLKVKNISKSINNKKIINDISFSISAGNIYGLLGPNGAGKTTTFYTIAGLIKSDKGKIFLGNEDLTKLPMHERSKLGIKYLPQEPSIFLDLTVKENLLGLAEKQVKKLTACNSISTIGYPSRLAHHVDTLSASVWNAVSSS